jgi:hypothetical protein
MANIFKKLFKLSDSPYPSAEKTIEVKKVHATPVKIVEVGSSGTEIYAGYIDEEYLHDLKGTKAMKIYDKMRRSDPRIKMVLSAVKNPIKSADWYIGVKEDSEQAELQKKLIENILFNGLKKSWKKNLHEVLSMIDFGYSAQEITHRPVLKDNVVGPHVGLKSLKLVGQKTVERFNVNSDGTLKSITQYSNGDVGRNVNVPAEFILHFSIDKEGDNYEGVSMLRACYGPWLRKNNALKQESVGNQNFSTPIAVMSVPDGEQNSEQYARAVTFLENYANNSASYLIKPQGWELELVNNTFDSAKIRETIKSENEEIAFAFLANFLNLGSGSGGSYALSNDLSDFFGSSLEFIADEICETYNLKLIPDLIKLNFPNAECLVELKASGIADKAGKEFAEVIELLTRSKTLTPDHELEESLRKKYKLPKMVETEESELAEELGTAPVQGGAVEDKQATALNGAQVTSIVEVAKAYTDNILTRDSAIEILIKAFGMVRASAEVIIPMTAPVPDIKTDVTAQVAQFAEKKTKKETPDVIVKRIEDNAQVLKGVFRSGLEPIAKDMVKKLIAKYNNTTEAREQFAIFDIKPSGVSAYGTTLRNEFGKIVNQAYDSVAVNYKFADRISSNRARAKADLLYMTQLNDLEKAIFLQFGTSIDSTDSVKTLEADLMSASDKAIKTMEVGADIVSAQLENETRMDFFDENSDELESFTFYNGDPISEICQELNGSTYSINDPDLLRYTPPLHHNCKSVMIPNLKGDKNNPQVSGLPVISDTAKKGITLGECCNHNH